MPERKPKMVTLRPIGVTEDGAYVMLARRADARSGGWRIAVDDALLSHIEKAVRRSHPPPPAPPPAPPPPPPERTESKLSPKEIQAQLRQGRSVASIAKKAEVSLEWVERFSVPIVWERAGMATRARRATLVRARRGPSGLPLGPAVEANLKQRGVRPSPEELEAAWDAVKTRGRSWIVSVRYEHRNREQQARWELNPESGEVTPLDKLASELGWTEPRARRRS